MAGEFDDIRSRLEGIAEELSDLAIVRLRESIDAGGQELPVDEKRLTRARRAVEKAINLLRRARTTTATTSPEHVASESPPDRIDDDLLARVRRRYLEVNGDHPMTADDDTYVRARFQPVANDAVLTRMLTGELPLPSYLLADGTLTVPADHEDLADRIGGDRLHAWFVDFWPDEPERGEEEWADYLSGQYVCLRRVHPLDMRQKARMVDQARAAVERLRDVPQDVASRAALGEAIDAAPDVIGLDALLLPMTGYDRLRFDGPLVRDTWVTELRAAHLAPGPPDLPIRTDRLLLRARRPGDEHAFVAAWDDEDYVRYLLGGRRVPAETRARVLDRADPSDQPHRVLGLMVEHDGQVVGDLVLALRGPGLTQAEIGWTILPEASRQGFATEAASALLQVAFDHYALHRVVAELDARNAASAALCERLGMRRESQRTRDYWSKGTFTDSLEYAVLASEWSTRRAQ